MNFNNPPNAFQGGQLKTMGMLAGISDFTYLAADNFPYFIELKVAYGKQSPAQVKFEKHIVERGGIYTIVRTLEEFKMWANIAITHAGHRKAGAPMQVYAEIMRIEAKQFNMITNVICKCYDIANL